MIRRLLLAGLLSLSISATTSLLAQGTGASPSGSNTPSGAAGSSKASTSTSTGASTGSQNGNRTTTSTSGSTGASTTTSGNTGASATSGSTGTTTSGRGTTSTGQSRGENMGKMDAKHFVMQAAQDSMAEVQLGQLAQSKGTTAEVKAYGKMMVEDHTRANDELQAMAATKKLSMPKDIGGENQKTMAQLKKLTGTSFDKAYINAMVKSHEKTVKQFEQASTQLEDAELKAWAARTLPTLQAHLQHAQAMKGGTKASGQSMGNTGGSTSGSASVGASTSGGTTKAGASVGTGGSK